MGRKHLLDSNVVIDYLAGLYPQKTITWLNPIVNQDINTSVITKIEVLSYNPEKDDNYAVLLDFFDVANILELTESVVMKTIEIRQKNRIKLPDAIIAATAMVYELSLVSRNVSDFKNIDGLQLINPWDV